MSQENDKKVPFRRCNAKEELFARAVANGASQVEAFRQFWQKDELTNQVAAHRAHHIAKRPQVVARIAQIRKAATKVVLLSLTNRLGILSEIANDKKGAKKADRIRAVEVYTKISGDAAPERLELSGPEGEAIQVDSTLVNLTVEEKVAMIKAATAARTALT